MELWESRFGMAGLPYWRSTTAPGAEQKLEILREPLDGSLFVCYCMADKKRKRKKKMSRIFFTSDTHFGHGNIIKYCSRPFLADADKEALARDGAWHDGDWKGDRASRWRMTDQAVRMMDDEIISNINAVVGENDTLWHLGDWAFAPKHDYYRRCREYRDRIRCRHINMIWGNHDFRTIKDLFEHTYDHFEIDVEGQRIVLCHYAHAVWNKSHRGSWHLYGHSHGGAEGWLDAHMPGRRSIDVGVDNANTIFGKFRPFTFLDLKTIFSARSGFGMDHHVNPNAPTEAELLERG